MLATIYDWDGIFSESEPREVSWEEIKNYFNNGYDVAVWHTIKQHPTRKKPLIKGIPVILLDKMGKHFKQR